MRVRMMARVRVAWAREAGKVGMGSGGGGGWGRGAWGAWVRVRRVRAMRARMMARVRVAWARGWWAGGRACRCWSEWAAMCDWAAVWTDVYSTKYFLMFTNLENIMFPTMHIPNSSMG